MKRPASFPLQTALIVKGSILRSAKAGGVTIKLDVLPEAGNFVLKGVPAQGSNLMPDDEVEIEVRITKVNRKETRVIFDRDAAFAEARWQAEVSDLNPGPIKPDARLCTVVVCGQPTTVTFAVGMSTRDFKRAALTEADYNPSDDVMERDWDLKTHDGNFVGGPVTHYDNENPWILSPRPGSNG